MSAISRRVLRRDRRNVIAAYEAMLGRRPENNDVIERYGRVSVEQMLKSIADSPEYRAQRSASPFFYYNASFDARSTIAAHAKATSRPIPIT